MIQSRRARILKAVCTAPSTCESNRPTGTSYRPYPEAPTVRSHVRVRVTRESTPHARAMTRENKTRLERTRRRRRLRRASETVARAVVRTAWHMWGPGRGLPGACGARLARPITRGAAGSRGAGAFAALPGQARSWGGTGGAGVAVLLEPGAAGEPAGCGRRSVAGTGCEAQEPLGCGTFAALLGRREGRRVQATVVSSGVAGRLEQQVVSSGVAERRIQEFRHLRRGGGRVSGRIHLGRTQSVGTGYVAWGEDDSVGGRVLRPPGEDDGVGTGCVPGGG